MEDRSGSSYNLSAGKPASELETLQKQHEEKTVKIQELKKRIETVKLRLEQKKKKETPELLRDPKNKNRNDGRRCYLLPKIGLLKNSNRSV
ncbi:hypothetical protein V6Z11_D05G180400 [Gossypium hirsutum]